MRRIDDAAVAYDALRRGLSIAIDSGNRMTEAYLLVNLSSMVGTHGDAKDALDFLASAIENFSDAGTYSHMVSPLGVLASALDRIGVHERRRRDRRVRRDGVRPRHVPRSRRHARHICVRC